MGLKIWVAQLSYTILEETYLVTTIYKYAS